MSQRVSQKMSQLASDAKRPEAERPEAEHLVERPKAEQAEAGRPHFELDGEQIAFAEGETILKAALRHRREIPHYCYHPGLAITAQCRMCLVDVLDMGNGRPAPKLQTACSTPLAAGMRVDTTSAKVRAGQQVVNEFLLVNHPLDCPICDQAGECDLQDFAFKYGSGHSEMRYEKRVYGWREVGSYLMLERNRCIHCSRCERFSRDLVGSHDFGAFLRTHELTFDTFDDEMITHKFQGNLADICPVGCITTRDWRFKKRAWKLQPTASVCTGCATGCNVNVEQAEGRIYRIKPRENMAVNRHWMCDIGRLHFRRSQDGAGRLRVPQARSRGQWQEATWEAVYAALQARWEVLQKTVAGASQKAKLPPALALSDTQATNEELFLLKRLLHDAFGGDDFAGDTFAGDVLYTPSFAVDAPSEQAPSGLEDRFLYGLLRVDRSPNQEGAARLGYRPLARAELLPEAVAEGGVLFVLGEPFSPDEDDEGLPADGAKKNKAEDDDARTRFLELLKQRFGLIVQIGAYRSVWSEVADVILPARSWVERTGSLTNRQGRVQRLREAVPGPLQSRPQERILRELHAALAPAKPLQADSLAEVFALLVRQEPSFSGLAAETVEAQGQLLAVPPPAAQPDDEQSLGASSVDPAALAAEVATSPAEGITQR